MQQRIYAIKRKKPMSKAKETRHMEDERDEITRSQQVIEVVIGNLTGNYNTLNRLGEGESLLALCLKDALHDLKEAWEALDTGLEEKK